ncbi:MAG: UDP-glucose 4-epimerase GalE [Candidatus Omnitrophota bacterium]
MKILVTGGAGYIGSHTAVELAQAGYEPVLIDNFSNSRPSAVDGIARVLGRRLPFYEGDCCDADFMRRVFESEKDVAGAIHFAALKAVGESIEKPELYLRNNLGSLKNLMDAMEKFNARYLVFSSSACVYGEADELPVREETSLKRPESPYGETKQECERMIEEAVAKNRPFRAVSLRYFNPIGAHPSAHIGELPLGIPNNLVPFVTQTAAGILPELVVFGNDYPTPDGTAIRDYIHVVDLAKAHVKALEYLRTKSEKREGKCEKADMNGSSPVAFHPSPFHEIFNLGTGRGNSVFEVIKTFEEVNGLKLKYRVGARRQGDIAALYASCDKAQRELGWKATLTLAEGLRDAWKWQCSLK